MSEPTDRERLDWLENYVREHHSLMLWNGTFKPDFNSAGLSFGEQMKRSLRDAIDCASGNGGKRSKAEMDEI